MTKRELLEVLRAIKTRVRTSTTKSDVVKTLKALDKLIEDVEEEGVLDVQQPR